MHAFYQNRLLIVALFAVVALSGCDLFNSDDNPDSPTSPLLANVVVLGNTTVQANANGFAEYLGQVVNTGSVTARNVRVSVNIFNASNGLIDVASAVAVPADLSVQETGTFKVTSTTPLGQAITFEIVIEWD
jgi:hypothetical protein